MPAASPGSVFPGSGDPGVLVVRVGAGAVAASLGAATARRTVPDADRPEPGALWRATLAAALEVLDAAGPPGPTTVEVVGDGGTVVWWDVDTLGSPLPVARTEDAAAHLAGLAATEPHTWALAVAGRYAAGDVASYLVARMTRGLEHLLLPGPAWDLGRCRDAGVPADILPEPAPRGVPVATTDPATFLGLAVPLTLRAPPAG
ncbi:hypothetical protein FE634_13795 [Nocardioides dongxiaopingii]|uniref:hypothetical protein n=1 Tax=Nocardioides sp. S-1144 TaxID=2582905 RepID=UPI00110E72A5|nr:hypothetical protein [Nocardioides sp. S-1144]QCW51212.1 hypothetical protein FE634_13795 [Nocardioides sp. S-1144]